ncbi:EAL and HDOD domain-containing protein [Pelotalea chapellei]|uniref:EAL domain-containing protein n=1 Tax=Pelotalea chapellei TaxID=44671 RepID=A0ABS5UAJ5_9BACT|nr:EAL domain-containing protein [Pelotalea chapellei]MBT1072701.1 EAL domain-containing protein [Pelotalea chapellei]
MTEENRKRIYFLGRQPVLNCKREIVGYELLFRSTYRNAATITNHDVASASVISSILAGFGLGDVLGDKMAFINVNQSLFFSELLEVLPHGQTILELLELVTMDDKLRSRCIELKRMGFRLSLDDHIYAPELEEFYKLVDIVKLDILAIPPEQLAEMVGKLLRSPIQLVAEKVETAAQFEACRKMGFHLFQGFFFQRPEMLRRDCLEPAELEMLQLLDRLRDNPQTAEIEEIFRRSPSLSFHLLKLVNSVNMGLRQKIKSLRHAITLVGLDKLRHWIHLALFATVDSHNRGLNNPLLEMAAVRGRLMERLVKQHHNPDNHDLTEAAFMTGIFSLFDVLFNVSMEEVINGLNLATEINDALLKRQGHLGQLLLLAEMVEQANFAEVERLLTAIDIPVEVLIDSQMDAFNWRGMVAA